MVLACVVMLEDSVILVKSGQVVVDGVVVVVDGGIVTRECCKGDGGLLGGFKEGLIAMKGVAEVVEDGLGLLVTEVGILVLKME